MTEHRYDCLFIGGAWVKAGTDAVIDLVNPATREVFAHVPAGTPEDAVRAIEAASAAKDAWAAVPVKKRVELMNKALEIFKTYREEIIRLEALELGSPVSFSAFSHCDYQFERIESYIRETERVSLEESFEKSTVLREPVGVVACITPWNYPLGQVVQKVFPALLMGNTVVIKPSQHTPLTCYLLVEALEKAGFPAGTVNLVTGKGSALGDVFAEHPLVDMVSFTGSTQIGIELSRKALGTVKRISLELGGKSPFIWLPSRDYEPALGKLFSSIFLNSGQTCTALSRLIVPKEDLERIKALLLKHIPELTVGDPLDPSVKIGPLASRAQYDKVLSYIELGKAEGAEMLCGGAAPELGKGWYVRPTVFTNVTNDMRIAREEIFGPVLCVITYDTVDEAVAIANDTPYGLSAGVFGEDREQALSVARRIHSGNVYVNGAPRDVTAPFGGYKQSGIGREGGRYGLMEFTQLKAVFDH